MIVTIKKSRKNKVIKLLSILFVIGMFIAYYFYQSNKFQEQELQAKKELEAQKIQQEQNDKNAQIEKYIILEIEKAVDLVGQENVTYVKIIENKAIIVCKRDVNLEALMVRYGTLALIKQTLNETIVALDLVQIANGLIKNES